MFSRCIRVQFGLLAAAILLSCTTAKADVLYTVTVNYGVSEVDGSYTFIEPSILTTQTTIAQSAIVTLSGITATSIFVDPTSGYCGPVSTFTPSCVNVVLANGNDNPLGLNADLTSTGNFYHPGYNPSLYTLTISQVQTVTPEPSSFVLLGTGLLGFTGVVRRRFC